MVLYKKSRYFAFLLWAISVFILCTGSLINFHQNKIWGKPLNFELVAVKRDGKSIIKATPEDFGSGGDHSTGPMMMPEISHAIIYAPPTLIVFNDIQDPLRSSDPPATGLRGPPSVS